MQKALLIPLRFLIAFLISAALLLFFCLIYNWSQTVSIDGNTEHFLSSLPETLSSIIFPAVSAALLFSFFSYRTSSIAVPAVIITAAAVFLILFFGYGMLTHLIQPKELHYHPFSSRTIQISGKYLIYTDSLSKDYSTTGIIDDVIIKNKEASDSRFTYYPHAQVRQGTIPRLEINNDTHIDIVPPNPVFSEIFSPGTFLHPVLQHIGYFGSFLRHEAGKNRMEQLFYTIVVTAFLMSCMLIKGTSSWPLFEFALVLALHSLVYYLFSLFSTESEFISETFLKGIDKNTIPLYTLAALTAVIFLVGIFIRLSKQRIAE